MSGLVREYYNSKKGYYLYLLIMEDGKIFQIDGCLEYEMKGNFIQCEKALKEQGYQFTGGEMYK